jgi:hypothetical protein
MKYLNLIILSSLLLVHPAVAQDTGNEDEVVTFSTAYFSKFNPLTALDMVEQVPGFELEESDDETRGYAGAAGNLLINNNRPSAKQDLPSAILARIPAGNVERIELIRGQVRGIDLRGQSAVINIITREQTQATVKWEALLEQPARHGPITPSINASLTDNWQEIEYNAGISFFKNTYGRDGTDQLFDGANVLTENRIDNRENRNHTITGNFNAVTRLGETLVNLNANVSDEERNQDLVSNRVSQLTGVDSRQVTFVERFNIPVLEFGIDAERNLTRNLVGKTIVLFNYSKEDGLQSQRTDDIDGVQTSLRVAEENLVAKELITRIELDWEFFQNHSLQLNMERAYNSLNGSLDQTLDTGSGPVDVDIPGANSFVKEQRWDFLLQDTWSGNVFELDYGLGAEVSTITQTGDAEQKRNFFFLKPQAVFTWSSDQAKQTRIRVAREVSQLDLTDFVSSTVFDDEDLALGNPDLKPDRTWITELSHERRFGRFSVITLRAFHHWISDVLDLLPLTPDFETPGNIGDGRRWGVEFETTIPLDWLGLAGSKFDIKARWQDSTVVDPVTGQNRILSSRAGDFPIVYNVENKYAISLNFRQDFEVQQVAWGWYFLKRDERALFKVNEFEVYSEQPQLNVFIETTRWFGIKVRLSGNNLVDSSGFRDRTIFLGERDLSPVIKRELRDRKRGPSALLSVSGVF